MDRDTLVIAVAAVLAGVTATMLVLGATVSLFFAFVAVPFGAASGLMWYQASGRAAARWRRRDARTTRARGAGTGAGPKDDWQGPRGGRRGAGPRGRRRRRSRTAPGATAGPSRAEAYRRLDLDPEGDPGPDAVKRAYREKVKEVHPDTEAGSEDAFKRVNRAYETLTDDDAPR